MNWLQRLARRREMERRLDAELQHHFEAMVAANRLTGLSEEESRRKALLEFGGMEMLKDECRGSIVRGL